jgi:hypothetical protein
MQTLQFFIKTIPKKRGLEKNLCVKKFIKNILYSKDTIQIDVKYFKDCGVSQNPSLSRSMESKKIQNKKGNFGFQPEIPQFESLDSTPRAGFEPATLRLTAACSTVELPRNRSIIFDLTGLSINNYADVFITFPIEKFKIPLQLKSTFAKATVDKFSLP